MNGFAMYDLIAKRNSTWGYLYPFIDSRSALPILHSFGLRPTRRP